MTKKTNLAAALHKASGKTAPEQNPVPIQAAAPTGAEKAPVDVRNKAQVIAPSRVGKKPITGFFDPAVSREMKQIALDQDSTVQALLTEAINDLLVKYGRNPIAS